MGLLFPLGVEVEHRALCRRILRPDERHDQLFRPVRYRKQIDLQHVSTSGASETASADLLGHVGFGKDFSVTTTLAPVSRRMPPICSPSSSGLIGLTMPATEPAKSVRKVSLRWAGRRPRRPSPRCPVDRKRFAVCGEPRLAIRTMSACRPVARPREQLEGDGGADPNWRPATAFPTWVVRGMSCARPTCPSASMALTSTPLGLSNSASWPCVPPPHPGRAVSFSRTSVRKRDAAIAAGPAPWRWRSGEGRGAIRQRASAR